MTHDSQLHESGFNENAEAQPLINPASLSPSPFGCDVQPMGPLQDMFGAFDLIVGSFPPSDRYTSQATFTGGIGPIGTPFGGISEPPPQDKIGVTVPSSGAPNPTQPL